ncbi:MAG: hypothetical protein GXP24_04005 [Planctomycetes bacterium]|nr:hypothetical protein [Planctomycetota bacterium]
MNHHDTTDTAVFYVVSVVSLWLASCGHGKNDFAVCLLYRGFCCDFRSQLGGACVVDAGALESRECPLNISDEEPL